MVLQGAAGDLAKHIFERGLRRISRLSRNYRRRWQRTIPDDLSGSALSRYLSGNLSRSVGECPGSCRKYFIPAGTPKANPTIANTWTWFSLGNSNYNALQVDANHRFSHGMSLRGVYTWSKTLDNGDSLNATTSANAPALTSNPFNLHADYGLGGFDVRNVAVISAIYELPFGSRAERWGTG